MLFAFTVTEPSAKEAVRHGSKHGGVGQWVVQAHCGCGFMAVTRDSGKRLGRPTSRLGKAAVGVGRAAAQAQERASSSCAARHESRHGRVVDSGAAARQWLNGYRRLAASRLTEENEGQNILRIDYFASV